MPRKILSCLLITTFSSGLMFSTTSQAGKGHQHQHGSHEHGTAQLHIAIEDQSLHLELASPAANLVGFEHKPRNAKQRQALDRAIATLKNADAMFAPIASAQCKPGRIKVDAGALQDTHHHHHDGHADFSASYVFHCAKPDNLATLQLMLFQPFPGIEQLQVQLISENGQRAMTVDASKATIRLK